MKFSKTILELGQKAKRASSFLRTASKTQKNEALHSIARHLLLHKASILKANLKDLEEAKKNQIPEAMLDRLSLQHDRLEAVIQDVGNIAALEDPVGQILEEKSLNNGMKLQKKRVPIGVLGIIYEARPNVTVDVATLALKTGNAAILRGGKETLNTNRALIKAIHQGLAEAHFPPEAIQLINSRSRSLIKQLLKLDMYVDMIIPRGGAGLHRFCIEESTIPVITGGIGICHLFVDENVNIEKAIAVIDNAKTQRPTVCNALDTVLVHKNIANPFLEKLTTSLLKKGVSFRLDEKAWNILRPVEGAQFVRAKEDDWQTEWLTLILGLKVVDSLEEAIAHIQNYSSNHSDGILTESKMNGEIFVDAIDSAAVYVNASTRFTDGGQFGLGAEVAVSTQKLHARGPMGLEELTSYKWIGVGDYHVRA